MTNNKLVVDRKEYERLMGILSDPQQQADKTYRQSIDKLSQELRSAAFAEAENMPEKVVRFNSLVTIETPFTSPKTYQLVAPDKSDISNNKISVAAPMGLALFGYAEADELLWQFPSGLHTIKILKVQQPLAAVKTGSND